ncbi:MAG: Endoglucanase precursor [Devosia sp.]|uniref:glycosyl hydrolase family 8 n=1 Tax=Devosia sp. TaxID=1871048 RepID=UPI0026241D56|nr:glycosyl hydrolase family 8 [Devosia sp.]MDB5587687.1 Endoglucanase precursor [Devosia sp.]
MNRLFFGALALVMLPHAVEAQTMKPSVIAAAEWAAYQSHFLADDGRIIDTGNDNISHSEGQGYGMLLAVLAQDRAAFERIWSFTQTELMVRDDGLAAWRWEGDKTPHVTDPNNASDGDTLIAYALALAGQDWDEPEKTEAATRIVAALGTMLIQQSGLTLLLPGGAGFAAADRADGPVVNPSYWIFEAYPVFAKLTPKIDWMGLSAGGLALLDRTEFAPSGLPADWVSLAGDKPKPAADFPAEFGYNNIRIPIYLMRAKTGNQQLKAFAHIGNELGLARVNVDTGAVQERLDEPGYRLIQAAIACTLDGTPVPAELRTFAPSSYYAATLQLLLLDHLRRDEASCLVEDKP